MEPPTPAARRAVVPPTKWRDTLVAVGAGMVVLAFVVCAVLSLGRQANSTGGVEGMIVGKEFVSRPETQVTVGQGGVHTRQLAGDYVLRVQVPQEHGKVYKVFVEPSVYHAQRAGDRYYFVIPKE